MRSSDTRAVWQPPTQRRVRCGAMRLSVLINRRAGSAVDADDAELVEQVTQAFTDAGASVEVTPTSGDELPGAMRAIWDGDQRPDAIVVAGGDGTVSSAAGVAAGTDLVVAVLPMGTFNHFAKDLGVPTDLGEAASSLVTGEVRHVDVGKVNDRVFVNNAALGVYPAMVAVRDDIRRRRGWGKIRAVPVAALRTLRAFPVHRFDLRGPDRFRRDRVRTPFVFVGNGAYDDEAGRVGDRTDLTNGQLGLYMAQVVSRWGLVRTVLRTIVSGAQAARNLERTQLSEVVITSRLHQVRMALDGEVTWMATPLRFRSMPGALRVLAPAPPPPHPPASDPNLAVHDQST